ncbi:MAG: hypothetical protein ABSG59_19165 [Verrucomicrobiota bacterium]
MISSRMAEVMEIEGFFPARLERELAPRHGYSAVTHKLEFFGVRPRRRATPAA